MAISLSLHAMMLHTSHIDLYTPPPANPDNTENSRASAWPGTSGNHIQSLDHALPPIPLPAEPELKTPHTTLQLIHVPRQTLQSLPDINTCPLPSRPLPSRPLPPRPLPSHPTFSSLSMPPQKSDQLPIQTFIKDPRILTALLNHLDWPDFLTLTYTCHECRDIFSLDELRDVILARYVPGYHYCLLNCDLQRFQDVQVTLHDLDLLRKSLFLCLISQEAPLNLYHL
jgi:hypothetical protein